MSPMGSDPLKCGGAQGQSSFASVDLSRENDYKILEKSIGSDTERKVWEGREEQRKQQKLCFKQ